LELELVWKWEWEWEWEGGSDWVEGELKNDFSVRIFGSLVAGLVWQEGLEGSSELELPLGRSLDLIERVRFDFGSFIMKKLKRKKRDEPKGTSKHEMDSRTSLNSPSLLSA